MNLKLGAAVRLDRDRVAVGESCLTHVNVHAVTTQVFHDAGSLGLLDDPFAAQKIAHRHLVLQSAEVEVIKLALAKAGQHQRRLAHGLGRKRPRVGRSAPEVGFLFDEGHALAEVSRLGGALLSCRAGADHNEIKFFRHGRWSVLLGCFTRISSSYRRSLFNTSFWLLCKRFRQGVPHLVIAFRRPLRYSYQHRSEAPREHRVEHDPVALELEYEELAPAPD